MCTEKRLRRSLLEVGELPLPLAFGLDQRGRGENWSNSNVASGFHNSERDVASPIDELIARAKSFELDTPYVPPAGDPLAYYAAGYAIRRHRAIFRNAVLPCDGETGLLRIRRSDRT
jgi:hypothetical protein